MFDKDLSHGPRNMHSYGEFQKILLDNLNNYAAIKKKPLRANNNKFMTKSLRKAILHRPQLYLYFKNKSVISCKRYEKQNCLHEFFKKNKKAIL